MYYLHTRWYDPEIGRFINLDQIAYLDPETINGLNLYAYCNDNPIMGVDPDGTDAIYVTLYEWGNNGLPIVGHTVLLIEDENGTWWLTEYTTTNALDWSTALVNCDTLANLGYESLNDYIKSYKPKNFWQKILSNMGLYGIEYVRYEGDYTGSLELAKGYKENGFGNYNAFTHNCLHYVKILLRADKSTDELMQLQAYSPDIIPHTFLISSAIAKAIGYERLKRLIEICRRSLS